MFSATILRPLTSARDYANLRPRKSKFGGFIMGSRAKACYFSSDRKIPSQNSLLVTKKFDWVLCGGQKPYKSEPLLPFFGKVVLRRR